MTLDHIIDLIHNTSAESGCLKLHLIMNSYTLQSLLHDLGPYLNQGSPPIILEPEEDIRILGYPTYINGQVPNDEVYVMYGDKPLNPPCKIWYGDITKE